MKQVFVIIVLLTITITFSIAQETPAPTPPPSTTGDLMWTRGFLIYDGTDPNNPPLAGVLVTASALETVSATTDNYGNCIISVLAHDTGSVTITAEKAGYLTYTQTYPGLPPSGSITIALEQDPVNTPEPTPSLPPYACARLSPSDSIVVNYPENLVVDVYNCGSDGRFSFHTSPSWITFPSSRAITAGETITITGTIHWDDIPQGSTVTGETWYGMSSGTDNVDNVYQITANYTLSPGAGDVWIFPDSYIVGTNSQFNLEIHANTGTQRLAAYGITLRFNSAMLSLDDVLEGPDGFVTAVGAGNPGIYVIQGFDTNGTGPGNDLHVLTLVFSSNQSTCGQTVVNIEVDALIDEKTEIIGIPQAYNSTVIITGCTTSGDVNNDYVVNIVDALLTAQYYVGLDVSINLVEADVNCDGSVDIVDALLIAQYYVGLIDTLC